VRGDPRELQLAFLHVGREYRRCGIARRLFRGLREAALRRGALRLYVSATPSESALGFYRSLGARLADPVDPDLFAREPEDVHLVLEL
jgi:ribosomal protein S18 acetylase RimI-like enzyme